MIDSINSANAEIYGLTQNAVNIYSFLPNNYITNKITAFEGLCSFKLLAMLSNVCYKTSDETEDVAQRLYLMTNKSIIGISDMLSDAENSTPFINVDNIEDLTTLGESVISGCIVEKTDGTEGFDACEYKPGDTPKNNTVTTQTYINAFVHIDELNNNTYVSEGFNIGSDNQIGPDIQLINKMPLLINPTMSTIYYGYLFKHNTDISVLNKLKQIKQIISIFKQASYTGIAPLPSHNIISKDLILPKISITDYYTNIGLGHYLPLPSASSERLLKNSEYNGTNLLKFNNSSGAINVLPEQIDGLEPQYINNIINEDTTPAEQNKIINTQNNILNYLLLFNNWNISFQQSLSEWSEADLNTQSTLRFNEISSINCANNETFKGSYHYKRNNNTGEVTRTN